MRRVKIVVTGAGGFIGSHVTEAFVLAGHDVKALVTYRSTGTRGWLEDIDVDVASHVEVVQGDVRDRSLVDNLVKGMDCVAHLAALIAIPYSYNAPESYVQTNIDGTLNVLEAARNAGNIRVVLTSTSEVYGTAQTVPITETHPLSPQSPYAATKVAADCLGLSYHRSFELPVTILRPFNTYGPRQSTRAVIPTIISQIAAGQREIALGSLSPTRDLLYVGDTAAGFVLATTCDAAIGQTIQLGTGFEISIGDLAHRIATLMNADVTIREDQRRLRPAASEVFQLIADNTRARDVLGWQPSGVGVEGLDQGLKQTIAWQHVQTSRSTEDAQRFAI